MSASVLLPVLAVAIVTAIASALLIAWPAAAALSRRPDVGPAKWAALLLTPLVLSALIVIALVTPALIGGCHCMAHGPHHPHLCPAHPILAAALLVPAASLVVIWLTFAAPRVARLFSDVLAARRWLGAQQRAAWLSVDGVRVRIVDCNAPLAVTAGALRPEIVVDEGLWNELDDVERRAIVHHEHAHAVRRDGLTLFVLRLSAALSLLPAATRLIERWRASAELECDRHASLVLRDPLAVASALVSVERISAASPTSAAFDAVLAARPGETLERRVRALIDADETQPPALANDLFAVACIAGGLALLTFVWPSDLVHHALETLIGWALG